MRILFVKLELQEQNNLLRRIAEALERMSPPIPAREPPERLSDLSDLRVIDSEGQRILQEVEQEFAQMTNTVPGSEAFQKAKVALEQELRDWRGEEAVEELPWNRIGRKT